MEERKHGVSSYTRWICESIKKICTKHGPRPAGSESAARAMHDMRDLGCKFADECELQPFTMHPSAFVGCFSLGAFFDLVGVDLFVLFLIYPYPVLSFLSGLSFLFSISVIFFEFCLYLQFTDKLYPRCQSHNLYLTRKARGESKRKIILVGHCDSAYEMPFISHQPRFLFVLIIIGAAVGKFLGAAFGMAFAFFQPSGELAVILGAVEVGLIVFFLPFLFFTDRDKAVLGANDNLTGCYLGLSILKEMSDNEERLACTDVCCLITDGEESGLRGAFAFAKEKRCELIKNNALVIAIDTIHDPKELMIYDRGINFTEKNGERAAALLKKAALASGIDIPKTPFYPGATDAEAFSREGIEAAGICAVSHGVCDYYHTLTDTHENLSEGCIELVRKILINAIKIYDKEA